MRRIFSSNSLTHECRLEIVAHTPVECPYCGGRCGILYRAQTHPLWVEMNNIDLYKCDSCDSVTTFPMPAPETLASCYSKHYVDGWPKGKWKAKKGSQQDIWYQDILKNFQIASCSKRKIADVGAGEGLLSRLLLSASADALIDCYDFHPMPEALKTILGEKDKNKRLVWNETDVSKCDWMPRDKYDIVFCIGLIEHVANPSQLVENLLMMCKKGGSVCIIGPTVDSLAYKIFRRRWVYMFPGEHLTLPSLKGLDLMLKKLHCSHAHLKRINVTYSLKYIIDAILKISTPKFLDVVLRLPTGAFSMKIRKC